MCGIAGFIDVERSRENAVRLIDRMCQVIRHRGPDDQGVWVGDGTALGMRRLSIIDLAGGHQPISNEDQSILVVFNGEIYNYRELRKELQERGWIKVRWRTPRGGLPERLREVDRVTMTHEGRLFAPRFCAPNRSNRPARASVEERAHEHRP